MASHGTRSGKLGYLREAIDSTVTKLVRYRLNRYSHSIKLAVLHTLYIRKYV